MQVIGKNHVAVPTHLYKIVLAESESSPTAMGKKMLLLSSPHQNCTFVSCVLQITCSLSLDPPSTLPSTLLPGVFVIPNKSVGDMHLTRFQVTLEELESHSGTVFHPQLDRSKASKIASILFSDLMFGWF